MNASLKMKLFLLVASIVALAGCPNESASSGPVAVCKSAGTQCKMSGGQLGVCSYDKQTLVCLSQH